MSEEKPKEGQGDSAAGNVQPASVAAPKSPDEQTKPPDQPDKPKEAPAKKSRPANCEGCNKSIKKKWYYRDGRYYCTKRCWKNTTKKKEEPQKQPAS